MQQVLFRKMTATADFLRDLCRVFRDSMLDSHFEHPVSDAFRLLTHSASAVRAFRHSLWAAMQRVVDLSIVIPVYNGSGTIAGVVSDALSVFANDRFEIVLVNDGSTDESEETCVRMAAQNPMRIKYVHLARNFGEHHAVLAGLSHCVGSSVGVLDDDGQNPPSELRRIWSHLLETDADVVYGRYIEKQHHWFRNAGSWFNDVMATWLLGKPRSLYFSSFKVMARPVVEEILKYRGPFPYLDGLIFRSTNRIGQIDVDHRMRAGGRSGYTLRRLLRLWLDMFTGFSIAPLRALFMTGAALLVVGLLTLTALVIDRAWIHPERPLGIAGTLICGLPFAGLQLAALGLVGEYVGRILMHQTGAPSYVVRYVREGDPAGE